MKCMETEINRVIENFLKEQREKTKRTKKDVKF